MQMCFKKMRLGIDSTKKKQWETYKKQQIKINQVVLKIYKNNHIKDR
jgi:hypothetical protein